MSRPKDFWSRRKAGVEAEKIAEERVAAEAHAAEVEAAHAEQSDEELLAELGLPDPDGLQLGDDFSGFMSKAVPDRLRRRALRRLWLSNPTLANVDGLVEYGEDYTDAATVVENIQTMYQVGKGMISKDEISEAEGVGIMSEAEDPDDQDPAPQDIDEDFDAEEELSAGVDDGVDDGAVDELAMADTMADNYEPARPRRMNFRFQQ